MPGVAENRRKWSEHNWEHEGHRWSPGGTAAGTDLMWWRSVRPRIHQFLPAGDVVEIAPGFGRWTACLLPECQRLTGVDITERCVDICRERFAAVGHAAFRVNDGESLPGVPDGSLDFAFSLDSLVHVEAPQIRRYLQELARALRPGGGAFLHHSNLGAYCVADGGTVPGYVRERHWRAQSMSARLFREICRQSGLQCVSQEIINWIGRDGEVDRYRLPGHHIPLTDCFSVCVRPREEGTMTTRVYVNRAFVDEWRQLVDLATVYADSAAAGGPAASASHAATASSDANRVAGVSVRVRRTLAAARERLHGFVFARREPVARTLRDGRCPDCGQRLVNTAVGQLCRECDAQFVLS